MTTIGHPHVRLDPGGVAWIDDANVKVIEVVLDRLAYGWSPEEIHFPHPHLLPAPIHAPLPFYYAHQPTLNAEIAHDEQHAGQLRRQAAESPLLARLKARGLLS